MAKKSSKTKHGKQSLQKLKTTLREETGTRAVRRLRTQGQIPAVIYGHKQDTVPIAVSGDDLAATVRHHSRMVELVIGKKTEQALLKDVQYDSLGTTILHADFERVALDEKIKLEVPVELKGQPKGASEGGVLEQILSQIEVECLATDIPEALVGDVRDLEIDGRLTVAGLRVPEGVTVLTASDVLVAVVGRPKVIEEVAPAGVEAEAVEAAEPELIRREAKEEEEEEEERPEKEKGEKGEKKG